MLEKLIRIKDSCYLDSLPMIGKLSAFYRDLHMSRNFKIPNQISHICKPTDAPFSPLDCKRGVKPTDRLEFLLR